MLKVYKEITLDDFEPWSGAEVTYRIINDLDLFDEVTNLLEDTYPDGLDETQLNDILWFEDEWIFESLGVSQRDVEKIMKEWED